MVNLVTLADAIVREQHLGYSGNYTPLYHKDALLNAVGTNEQALREMQQKLISKIEQRASALGLGKSSSSELYISALNQANQELGRMSEQLAAKNRRPRFAGKVFRCLAQFQGELRPDAPPAMVMSAIGQTAAAVLQSAPVAVFSIQPGQLFAEVVLIDGGGEVIATSVMDCPPKFAKPLEGEGPVLNAADDLEWIMAGISPRLAADQRFWICLETETSCIGGVVWGAQKRRIAATQPAGRGIVRAVHRMEPGIANGADSRRVANAGRTIGRGESPASQRPERIAPQPHTGHRRRDGRRAAHEMNNPLAVISGRSQLLATQLKEPKLKHAANTIAEQSHRLSQIITDLMEFAKPVPPNVQQTDLAELLEKTIYQVKGLSEPGNRKIEVTMGEVPPVKVDTPAGAGGAG